MSCSTTQTCLLPETGCLLLLCSSRDRLAEIGQRIGVRVLELLCLREKNSRRETKINGILLFVHTTVWKVGWRKHVAAMVVRLLGAPRCAGQLWARIDSHACNEIFLCHLLFLDRSFLLCLVISFFSVHGLLI